MCRFEGAEGMEAGQGLLLLDEIAGEKYKIYNIFPTTEIHMIVDIHVSWLFNPWRYGYLSY